VYNHENVRTKHTANDHSLKKVVNVNPTYNEGACFTNPSITNDDPVYDVVNPPPRQTNTDTIKAIEIPAYAETKLAVKSVNKGRTLRINNSKEEDYENMYPQPRQGNRNNSKVVESPVYIEPKMLAASSSCDKGTHFDQQ